MSATVHVWRIRFGSQFSTSTVDSGDRTRVIGLAQQALLPVAILPTLFCFGTESHCAALTGPKFAEMTGMYHYVHLKRKSLMCLKS